MASSTPQPAAEFYEWALKRYQRRSVALTRSLIVMTLATLLIAGLFLVQVRELRTQTITTRTNVEHLHDQLLKARSASARRDARTAAYVKCLESRTRNYAEGMTRLLHRKISVNFFIKKYKPNKCR